MGRLGSMTDAIGRELKIGDFVMAVFANAELDLFKITGFHDKHRYGTRGHSGECAQMVLANPTEYQSTKSVYKPMGQISWVDPDYVFLKILKQ
jgi:hypothetical protein